MPRSRRRPHSTATPLQATAPRGITPADVDRAADSLLRAGQRPTIEKVRAHVGRGSPNTINPLLDAWWGRLAGRLDAGPAALHRLPEAVLLAAEAIWLQALDDARKRATTEQGSRRTALAQDRQALEVRAHVLSIRETELRAQLQDAERRTSRLQDELEALTTLLRKEQASRLAAERRLHSKHSAPRRGRATEPTAAQSRLPARKAPRMKSRKVATKTTRGTTVRPRTLKGSRR